MRARVRPGRFDVVIEQLDPRGRSLDPGLVGARDEDARVEGVGELDVGRVEMRVGQADCGDSAEVGDLPTGLLVEQRDTVPQHVAVRGAHQQRPLADREGRLDADADQVSLLVPQDHRVAVGDLGHGRPLLAVPADVLAFVLTDRAAARRPVGVWVLHAAGNADPRRHQGLLSSGDTRAVPIRPTEHRRLVIAQTTTIGRTRLAATARVGFAPPLECDVHVRRVGRLTRLPVTR